MKSENSKYENFIQLSNSTKNLEEEIEKMYNNEYDDLFEDIIRKKEGDFMRSIVYNVRISIIDKYTEESFENENLKKIMKDIERNLYLDKYLVDSEKLKKTLISKGRFIENGENFSFLKHCKYQEDNPIHFCNKKNNFIIVYNNNNLNINNNKLINKSSNTNLNTSENNKSSNSSLNISDNNNNNKLSNKLSNSSLNISDNSNNNKLSNRLSNVSLTFLDNNNKFSSSSLKIQNKEEIYGIICTNCLRCYKLNYIKLYCDFCQILYYTRIITNEENDNSNIQPATWEKYHCRLIINQQMGCINCKGKLFLDVKNNILICKECNFSSNPYDIIWTCMKCKQDFHSNAKIYNPYIYKPLSLAIKNSLINKILALPSFIPCNHNIKEFYHKKECNGIAYISNYNGRKMVLCSKCKSMIKYEKFIFECPICNLRFRDENNDNFEEEDHIDKEKKKKKIIDDIYNKIIEKEIKDNISMIDENKNLGSNANTNNTDNIKDLNESNLNSNLKKKSKTFKFSALPKEEIDFFKKKSNTINIDKNINKKNDSFIIDENQNTFKTDFDLKENKNNKMKIKENKIKENIKEKNSLLPSFEPKNYEIISQIGESKKSKIYCVRNIENNKFLALKKINYKTKEELNKIISEYSFQYSLKNNPYIIQIEGIYTNENEIEILEELGLNNWQSEINSMKKMKKLYNEIDLVNIIYQISVALEILQKKNIAHFSINPNNIIVFKDSIYKISDFEHLFYISNSQILQNNNKFISPNLYNIYYNKINNTNFNVVKNDVYSLGLCILFTFIKGNELDLFRDFVNINDNHDNYNLIHNYIKEACKEENDKNFYSDKFKKLLCNMLKINENERFDFTQVIDFICKKYEFED